MKIIEAVCKAHGWEFDAPIRDLPPEALQYLLYAAKDQERVLVRYRHERGENTYKANFEGIITNLERRYRESDSDYIKAEIEKFMVTKPCPTCKGRRLKPEVLAVTVDGRNISEVAGLSVTEALDWGAIYDMLDPVFREKTPKEDFLRGTSRFLFLSHAVDWLEVTGRGARVKVSFLQKLNDPTLHKLDPEAMATVEPWIKIDGEWFRDMNPRQGSN